MSERTSLADLGTDELDFVELVMELEEEFNISIPDDAAESLLGSSDWQTGMKNVTLGKLTALVVERKKSPVANDIGTKGQPPSNQLGSDPGAPAASSAQIKVYLNPLAMLLAGAEKQKGEPLTRDEVLSIRDTAAFIMMTPEQAEKFYSSLDSQVQIPRLDPDRVWEEWQQIRGKIK